MSNFITTIVSTPFLRYLFGFLLSLVLGMLIASVVGIQGMANFQIGVMSGLLYVGIQSVKDFIEHHQQKAQLKLLESLSGTDGPLSIPMARQIQELTVGTCQALEMQAQASAILCQINQVKDEKKRETALKAAQVAVPVTQLHDVASALLLASSYMFGDVPAFRQFSIKGIDSLLSEFARMSEQELEDIRVNEKRLREIQSQLKAMEKLAQDKGGSGVAIPNALMVYGAMALVKPQLLVEVFSQQVDMKFGDLRKHSPNMPSVMIRSLEDVFRNQQAAVEEETKGLRQDVMARDAEGNARLLNGEEAKEALAGIELPFIAKKQK